MLTFREVLNIESIIWSVGGWLQCGCGRGQKSRANLKGGQKFLSKYTISG